MKITDIEVLRMQAHVEPHNNWLFVRVHTDAGISGIGEGSLQYKDDALQAEIDLSVNRRLLIRKAHDVGTPPNWDYVAPQNDARWCRTGSNYNEWSLSVLKTK